MKSVLHVTRDFPPRSTGGLSTAVCGMVRALAEQGVQCQILSFDEWRPAQRGNGGFTVETNAGIAVARVRDARALQLAHRWASQQKPRVVHAHHALLWQSARDIAETVSAKTVYTAHVVQRWLDQFRSRPTASQSTQAEALALAEADSVTAPSDAAARTISDLYQCPLPVVTPLGIALPTLVSQPRGGLVYVGRFADVNGTLDAFRVFAKVAEHIAGPITLAGGLPASPRSERKWHALAEPIMGENFARLDFIGWQSDAQLATLYNRAQVLLAPSYYETFGLVVAEAMSHGVAVVTTNAGALPELIDTSCGRICEPGEIDSMANAVSELLDDHELSSQLGHAARSRIASHFSWRAAVIDLLAVYA